MAKDIQATAYPCGGECNKNEAAKRVTIPASVKRMAGLAAGIVTAGFGAYFATRSGSPEIVNWAGLFGYFGGSFLTYASVENTRLAKMFEAALPKTTGKVAKMVNRFQKARRATYKDNNGKDKHLSAMDIMRVTFSRGKGSK